MDFKGRGQGIPDFAPRACGPMGTCRRSRAALCAESRLARSEVGLKSQR